MKKAISMLLALAMALSLPLAAHCEGTAGGTNDTALTTLSDGGLSAGVQTENSYWNDAMSIGCTFGSKWYFYTDEEIAEQNGLATGMLREDYAKLVEAVGFEPTNARALTVFRTAAFNHSATPPL